MPIRATPRRGMVNTLLKMLMLTASLFLLPSVSHSRLLVNGHATTPVTNSLQRLLFQELSNRKIKANDSLYVSDHRQKNGRHRIVLSAGQELVWQFEILDRNPRSPPLAVLVRSMLIALSRSDRLQQAENTFF